ncbi:hypothetical protein N6B72_10070 [Chryseobacterium soli]|uniref:hypothetical protein n=1 Tax=Chryseobacterium soli TaxID=445961 RepID=UPI002955D68A|nr:hypothetical protein [Chryseobacterium soli]MDV7697265.1 hypothetical protein [Chryseobacterium soli]
MKKFLLTATMLVGFAALSQAQQGRVGINTSTPAATLDVVATTTDATRPDALLVPRMTRAQLYAKDAAYLAAQDGALVFVNTIDGTATTKTANVTTAGFYYYDGRSTNTWIAVGGGGASVDTSLYLNDGTLAGPRVVTQNNNNLTFTTGTAKAIVNGSFQTQGGVYNTSVRTYTGATNVVWTTSDYFVILTNPAISGQLALPSPTGANAGRILCIRNNSGVAIAPTGADGVAWPLNFANLTAGSGAMFISDGTNWWNAASR